MLLAVSLRRGAGAASIDDENKDENQSAELYGLDPVGVRRFLDIPLPEPVESQTGERAETVGDVINGVQRNNRENALDDLLRGTEHALGVMVLLSVLVGWLAAGRVLRPVKRLTLAAQDLSETNLDRRIDLEGPERRAQGARRHARRAARPARGRLRQPAPIRGRRVARAAHAAVDHPGRGRRRRSPIPTRAAKELRLALAVNDAVVRAEALIDSLLALARSDSTMHERKAVDLAELTGDVVGERVEAASTAGVEIDLDLGSATVEGDRWLLERLVANLVDNGINHNAPHGWVRVAVDSAERLDPPRGQQQRRRPHRRRRRGDHQAVPPARPRAAPQSEGFGLGMTIVQAVADAHNGQVDIDARSTGGLDVVVSLPTAKTDRSRQLVVIRRAALVALGMLPLALALVACASDDESSSTTPTVSPDAVEASWPEFGFDAANSRANPHEVVVGVDNVGDLTEKWEVEGLEGVTATPAVVDGVVYVGDFTGSVRAFDAETGDEVWATQLETGAVYGTPAITDDRVFAGDQSGFLHALDRETGEVLWTERAGEHASTIIFNSPVTTGDLVIAGVGSVENFTTPEDFTFQGSVSAYDQATGEERWRAFSTPNDETRGRRGGDLVDARHRRGAGARVRRHGPGVRGAGGRDERLDHRHRRGDRRGRVAPPVHRGRRALVQRHRGHRARRRRGRGAQPVHRRRPRPGRRGRQGRALQGARPRHRRRGVVDRPHDRRRARRGRGHRRGRRRHDLRGVEPGRRGVGDADGHRDAVRPRRRDRRGRVGARAPGLALRFADGRQRRRLPGHAAADDARVRRRVGRRAVDLRGARRRGRGPSVVDGVVYWGYGFYIFEQPDEPLGGLLAFALDD